MRSLGPTLRAVAFLLSLVAILLLLHYPLAGGLHFPALGQIGFWLSDTEPAVAFATGLRAAALAMAWYLAAITTLQLTLALVGLRSTLIDALTPTLVRQLLGMTLLIATVSTAAAPAALASEADQASEAHETEASRDSHFPPVTMVRLGIEPAQTEPPVAPAMTMTRLGPVDQPAMEPAIVEQPQQPSEEPPATWRVDDGEHFWYIAGQTLAERTGQVPSNVEIDRYWRKLIELNQGRLIDPANPDLIVAGQVFELPTESTNLSSKQH
ncbi:MAG: hypothetical protein V3V01_13120 [Acidimicrobiales bacterium]